MSKSATLLENIAEFDQGVNMESENHLTWEGPLDTIKRSTAAWAGSDRAVCPGLFHVSKASHDEDSTTSLGSLVLYFTTLTVKKNKSKPSPAPNNKTKQKNTPQPKYVLVFIWYFQFLICIFSLLCCQSALLRITWLLLLYKHRLFIYNFWDLLSLSL